MEECDHQLYRRPHMTGQFSQGRRRRSRLHVKLQFIGISYETTTRTHSTHTLATRHKSITLAPNKHTLYNQT